MDKQEAEMFGQMMTECAYSYDGCNRMPVRMIFETNVDGDADGDIVLLCKDHAGAYQPEGRVISDEILVPDEFMHLV